jgi:hypothetical protein
MLESKDGDLWWHTIPDELPEEDGMDTEGYSFWQSLAALLCVLLPILALGVIVWLA